VIRRLGPFDRVLEVGCGNGALLNQLKRDALAKTVVGLDPHGQLPPENMVDEFYRDSVENVISKLSPETPFDLIIFADVLEHLEDPWGILSRLSHHHLSPGGTVIISVPNFRNVFTLGRIVAHNSFRYQAEGVLDKTHLRFFCRRDLNQLVSDAGLHLKFVAPNFKFKKGIFFRKNRLLYLNRLSLNLFPFWLTDQMIAVAQRPS
jgi:2-polyprenyl-3-methyl-5-hydroxy-6-metoxy-1,4-benzoquinol methylase